MERTATREIPRAQSTSRDPAREEQRTAKAIRQAGQGDPEGLHHLYLRYAPEVHAYVRRILPNDYDAEDVTQQVFLKLTTRLWRYEPERAQFLAWMLRVARNAAIDRLRQERRALLHESLGPEVEGADGGGDPDRRASLREALEALPPSQRDVLLLRDVAGLTPSEVARRVGKSRGAVNTCYHRAHRSARRTLEAHGWAPVTGRRPMARAT